MAVLAKKLTIYIDFAFIKELVKLFRDKHVLTKDYDMLQSILFVRELTKKENVSLVNLQTGNRIDIYDIFRLGDLTIQNEKEFEILTLDDYDSFPIFLIKCLKKGSKYSTLCITIDSLVDSFKYFNNLNIKIPIRSDFKWKMISQIAHPVDEIIINDLYIGKNRNLQENLGELIISIIDNKNISKATCCIIYGRLSPEDMTSADIVDKVESYLHKKDIFNIKIISCAIDIFKIKTKKQYTKSIFHDRNIISNLLFINSGDSFEYIIYNHKRRIVPKNTTFSSDYYLNHSDCFSVSMDKLNSYQIELKRLYEHKLVNIPTEDFGFRLLDFSFIKNNKSSKYI